LLLVFPRFFYHSHRTMILRDSLDAVCDIAKVTQRIALFMIPRLLEKQSNHHPTLKPKRRLR
jgi:hypothetical protein